MKKGLAVLLTVIIVFLWIITLSGIGHVGPLKDKIKLGLDLSGGVYVVMEAQTDATGEELSKLMKQTQLIIEERVNQMGLSEPNVTIEGQTRIRVELPGAENAEDAINTIGKTAQLQFVLADGSIVVDGSNIKDAGVAIDQQRGGYVVTLEFDGTGAKLFEEGTRKAASGTVAQSVDAIPINAIGIVLDDQVISAPNVSKAIVGGTAQIEGSYTEEEAMELAMLIRAGALPVNMQEVEAKEVAATLGIDALKMSIIAGIIGVALIFIVMVIMYRVMGLIANLALLMYIPLVFWIMTLLGSVLTLPGIAGIILSVGMAVDANVIIFARIREEIINGKTVRVAVNAGYKRAMTTVIDSQITTIIAGVVLYIFGNGPVRGFALTLMIGIVISIFTAAIVTQLYLQVVADTRMFSSKGFYGVKKDNHAAIELKKEYSFIKHRKIFYIVSVAIIVIGLGTGLIRGFNAGIDFTGGTMLQLDMGKQVSSEEVQKVLDKNDINATINHAGEGNSEIIIRTTQAMNTELRTEVLESLYDTFDLTEESLITFEQFGPSIGDLMKKNAVKAIIFASLGMLVYIIIRFEWKFGIASLVGVLHDVIVLVAFYGLLYIPINNPFIAGVLTVVGYSINDTIVIFDRVRENINLNKKGKLEGLLDRSINQTLVRSIMTSITTVLAIVPLYILGGETIRQFTLPLIIGILAGAASSIFICSPVYYEICNFINKPKYQGK